MSLEDYPSWCKSHLTVTRPNLFPLESFTEITLRNGSKCFLFLQRHQRIHVLQNGNITRTGF